MIKQGLNAIKHWYDIGHYMPMYQLFNYINQDEIANDNPWKQDPSVYIIPLNKPLRIGQVSYE